MAADVPTSVGRDTEFITLERPIRDMPVDPGGRYSEEVVLKNQTARAIVVTPTTRDLATRRNGSSTLRIEDAGSQPRGAGEWLSVPTVGVRILPFSQATIRVRINVPADAGAGAWGGAVVLDVAGAGAQSTVTLHQETSVAFLFGVSGTAQRDVNVHVEPDTTFRFHGGRATWRVKITNAGDAFESFGGTFTVDRMAGAARTFPIRTGILFPGEQRTQRFSVVLREAPDRIRARAQVDSRGRSGARDTGASDTRTTADAAPVYVLPWWLPVVLLIGSAVIVWRVRTVRRRSEVDDEAVELFDP